MNKYLFCIDNQLTNPVSCGFWPCDMKEMYVKAGTWPDHGVEVDQETRDKFTQSAPTGKTLGADDKGNPCWLDLPPPSHDELVKQAGAKKHDLLKNAKHEMIFYAGLVMAGDNSAQTHLTTWKTYWQQLTEIDCSQTTEIIWPPQPDTE